MYLVVVSLNGAWAVILMVIKWNSFVRRAIELTGITFMIDGSGGAAAVLVFGFGSVVMVVSGLLFGSVTVVMVIAYVRRNEERKLF